MNNLKSNCFHYWQWFAFNNQEELYDVIMSMIKNYAEEVIPEIIKRYLREYYNNFALSIQTTLNGKSINSDVFEDEIQKLIIKSLNKE